MSGVLHGEGGEECDDGNTGDGDGCSSTCTVEDGWLCEGEPSVCVADCNLNGVEDAYDIANGTSDDCQPNGVPDECDIAEGTSADCQPNEIPDECDELCAVDPDCDDGDECTLDTCNCGDPKAGLDGCVHEYQQRLFGDIVPEFCTNPPDPPCPQPNIGDIMCVLDDFADGPTADGCGNNDPPESTDLAPCGGDTVIDVDDILAVLDAFGQSFTCPHPCP